MKISSFSFSNRLTYPYLKIFCPHNLISIRYGLTCIYYYCQCYSSEYLLSCVTVGFPTATFGTLKSNPTLILKWSLLCSSLEGTKIFLKLTLLRSSLEGTNIPRMIHALLISSQGESTIIGGNSSTVAQVSTVVPVEIDTSLWLYLLLFIAFQYKRIVSELKTEELKTSEVWCIY